MATKKNPTKPITRKKSVKEPAPAEGLVLVRYSTPGNSWISAYANAEVAKTRVIENARVHFSGQWDDGEVTEQANDIRLKIDQKEPVIEIDEWNAEIEYSEKVYTY